MPYVITHELICHIGARAIKRSRHQPDTAIRMFFADGFIDCVAWLLVTLWLDSGALEHDIPVGHLTESDVEYTSRRPAAFRAGRAAWSNCAGALSADMRGADRVTAARTLTLSRAAAFRAEAEARCIETALRLNADPSGVPEKNAFVDVARGEAQSIQGTFAAVAAGRATPPELFERAIVERMAPPDLLPSQRILKLRSGPAE